MLRIRLKRMGRRKRPFYRIVVIDSRSRRDGREIERLGWFDPLNNENELKIDDERVLHWLNEGAQPSETVSNLFKKTGLSFKWHLTQQGKSQDDVDKELSELLAMRKSKHDEVIAKKEKAEAKEEKVQVESDLKSQQDTVEEASESTEEPKDEEIATEVVESVEEDSSK